MPKLTLGEMRAGLKLAAPVRKAVLDALGERDEAAAICRDAKGNPSDPELRGPPGERAAGRERGGVLAREVPPYVADAWLNETIRDPKDGGVGCGLRSTSNRYF